MKTLFAPALLAALALSACSAEQSTGDQAGGETAQAPTVAYGYSYRFELPGAAVDTAQDRHIALCDAMGPARCRMQEMHRSSGTSGSDGSTRFAVASGEARRFGQALLDPVRTLGGKLASRDFEAEDLGRQQADVQAKAAEKNDADNRAAVTAVRDRLETSKVEISYDGKAGFGEQVGEAFGAAGETLTGSVVALIYFLTAVLPWGIALGVIVFAVRAFLRWTRRMLAARGRGAPPAESPVGGAV